MNRGCGKQGCEDQPTLSSESEARPRAIYPTTHQTYVEKKEGKGKKKQVEKSFELFSSRLLEES